MGRWSKAWNDLALLFFNTAVLFVLVNLAIGFGFKPAPAEAPPPAPGAPPPSTDGRPQPGRWRTGWQLDHIDMAAYAEPVSDVEGMLDDMTQFSNLGVAYQPWVQYGPPLYKGRFVNVEGKDPEFPFRHTVSPTGTPAGKPVEVYLFGGSTVFGWDTADAWTLGSALWASLQLQYPQRPVHLVNYGRPLYYSSQEVLLFYRLLKTGHRPDVAIFLDGLNDVYQLSYQRDQPWMTPRLSDLLHRDQVGKSNDLENYQWIPLVKLAFYLRQKMEHKAVQKLAMAEDSAPTGQVSKYVLDMYRANRRLASQVGQADGVQTWFFWQPCPFVDYDMSLHRTPPPLSPRNQEVYRLVYSALQTDPDTVYLGDLAKAYGHRKIYVDDVHYGPDFTRFLADRMAQAVHLP
ncbi:MAG TPA: SGNH/GDSL hydrolase family protein [Candidatus Xenobia bacterium]